MTIKEVENTLNVPRATIRFYEKEGFISPSRSENGYREYSRDDVVKLQKVIILRKVGIPVDVITDVFDGVKSMQEVLTVNIIDLQRQMSELEGSINLCKRMQCENVEIGTFETEKYWNYVNEEERNGNAFLDIARDIAEIEKEVIFRHFSFLDEENRPIATWQEMIRNGVALGVLYGCIKCVIERDWNVKNFLSGLLVLIATIVIECLCSVPIYFLGKKIPWIAKNRNISMLILSVVLLMILVTIVFII